MESQISDALRNQTADPQVTLVITSDIILREQDPCGWFSEVVLYHLEEVDVSFPAVGDEYKVSRYSVLAHSPKESLVMQIVFFSQSRTAVRVGFEVGTVLTVLCVSFIIVQSLRAEVTMNPYLLIKWIDTTVLMFSLERHVPITSHVNSACIIVLTCRTM